MERVTTFNTKRKESDPKTLLVAWQCYLQEHDHSVGTIKKYTQAVSNFLAWYAEEEHVPLQLTALTPIALIGYRNSLQHEQHKSISTIRIQAT